MRLGCGYPMGPLALLDLIGLDTAYEILDTMYKPGPQPAARADPDPQADGDRRVCSAARSAMASTPTRRRTPDRRRRRPDTHRRAGPAAAQRRRRPSEWSGRARWRRASWRSSPGWVRRALRRPLAGEGGRRTRGVEHSLEKAVQRGRLERGRARRLPRSHHRRARVWTTCAEVDLVVEAVVEDLGVKKALFENLDEICKPARSWPPPPRRLPVIECAAVTRRPRDVVGMHFFNPPTVMRLVEVVSTVATDDDVAETVRAVCVALGKQPVSCGDRAGLHRQRAAVPLPQRRGAACSRRTTRPPTTSTPR